MGEGGQTPDGQAPAPFCGCSQQGRLYALQEGSGLSVLGRIADSAVFTGETRRTLASSCGFGVPSGDREAMRRMPALLHPCGSHSGTLVTGIHSLHSAPDAGQ